MKRYNQLTERVKAHVFVRHLIHTENIETSGHISSEEIFPNTRLACTTSYKFHRVNANPLQKQNLFLGAVSFSRRHCEDAKGTTRRRRHFYKKILFGKYPQALPQYMLKMLHVCNQWRAPCVKHGSRDKVWGSKEIHGSWSSPKKCFLFSCPSSSIPTYVTDSLTIH